MEHFPAVAELKWVDVALLRTVVESRKIVKVLRHSFIFQIDLKKGAKYHIYIYVPLLPGPAQAHHEASSWAPPA